MMFVTKKEFLRCMRIQETAMWQLTHEFWELRRSHERLLAHLKLYEAILPAKTELRTKGEAEKGDDE
jgi:hypothetical protein